jgi:hypothetical protein
MRDETHESHASNTPSFGGNPRGETGSSGGGGRGNSDHKPQTPNWPRALLVIAVLPVTAFVAGRFVGSLIPLWLVLGVAVFYCVEKWLGYYTWKHRTVGRIYRLILNLSALSLLGLLIWSGVLLFTQRFMESPLVGSLVFVFEFAVFIWLCKVVARNGWRQPSMKLTVFSTISLLLIFSFAGVQPLSACKDSLFNSISTYLAGANQLSTTPTPADTTPSPVNTTPPPADTTPSPTDTTPTSADTTPSPTDATPPPADTTPSPTDTSPSSSNTTPSYSDGINYHTGRDGDFYLGLVYTPGGYLVGNGCYDDAGDFIVLINNENAVNPSYSQLLSFLRQDSTDEFPYTYVINPPTMYYGTPESHVDLERIENIIEGTIQPGAPGVCGDFAERLHNNAELAGIRCAYVCVTLAGNAGHACDAFQTTDRGLVYIDCTGISGSYGPDNNDKIVDIEVGEQYNPEYLFPSGGWYIPGGTIGTVTDFQIIWDGTWNN